MILFVRLARKTFVISFFQFALLYACYSASDICLWYPSCCLHREDADVTLSMKTTFHHQAGVGIDDGGGVGVEAGDL